MTDTDAPTNDNAESDFDALTHADAGPVILKEEGPRTSRRLVFTLNNWTQPEYDALTHDFSKYAKGYIIAKETGKKHGTPHLQGYVELKNNRHWSALKLLSPRAHWGNARKCRKANIRYCSKEKEYVCTFKDADTIIPNREKLIQRVLKTYENVQWKDWQQTVLYLLTLPPEPRTIYWFWEATGGVGKSYLQKYIACTYPTIIVEGKRTDIQNQINTYIETKGLGDDENFICLVNVPRSSFDYVNYTTLEVIKDGCFYSGKYEGGMCIYPTPHLIVFANEQPNWNAMTTERWSVWEIKNNTVEETVCKQPLPNTYSSSAIKPFNYLE